MKPTSSIIAGLTAAARVAADTWADTPPAAVQNLNFNASHPPYDPASAKSRIAASGFPSEVGDTVLTAVNFERSNLAGTSVRLDPFYLVDEGHDDDLPSNWKDLPAGSVLRVERVTNTSMYTIPMTTALSRFLFTTRTLNGTVIPASAYVLWPWLPRDFNSTEAGGDGGGSVPVIAWAHGTSGWSGECGPSNIRSLWYQFQITTAATQGFAVVAPDYAGLGVERDGDGEFIRHPYLVSAAHGNDLLYAAKAAQKAWSDVLTESYVVMGHSQGGGAAWGAAMNLADDNRDDIEFLRRGYLGTVAGSPWTSFASSLSTQLTAAGNASIAARISTGIKAVYPDFKYSDWLTDLGVRAVELMQDLQGCNSVAAQLFTRGDMLRPDWQTATWYYEAWNELTSLVGKPILGPMLVMQGSDDGAVNVTNTRAAVDAACEANPDQHIEYLEHKGVGHTPIMFSAQQTWLEWMADRFKGKTVKSGCKRTHVEPLMKVAAYQYERNYVVEWSDYSYVLA